MRDEFEFKAEYFLAPLFITLGVLSVKYVGFYSLTSSIFTFLAIIQVPLSFIAIRYCRKMIYSIIRGYIDYED